MLLSGRVNAAEWMEHQMNIQLKLRAAVDGVGFDTQPTDSIARALFRRPPIYFHILRLYDDKLFVLYIFLSFRLLWIDFLYFF